MVVVVRVGSRNGEEEEEGVEVLVDGELALSNG